MRSWVAARPARENAELGRKKRTYQHSRKQSVKFMTQVPRREATFYFGIGAVALPLPRGQLARLQPSEDLGGDDPKVPTLEEEEPGWA